MSSIAFATGTGRCGTKFLARVLEHEPDVASCHERNPFAEAFHRYCIWNDLPVDDAGYMSMLETAARADLQGHRVSFEASAYLALGIDRIAAALRHVAPVRFVLLVRRPDHVVNSYVAKGWYANDLQRGDRNLAAGFQPSVKYPHHPLSRITPRGPEAEAWEQSPRVGKIAWFWRVINDRVLAAFESLPSEECRVVRLEELSYETYLSLADFMGFEPRVTRDEYETLAAERPNTLGRTQTVLDWSAADADTFEREVREVAERLGYPWRVADLASETSGAHVDAR